MIRAKMSNDTFLFGLDAVNIFRLMDGQPIHVDLREMGGTDRFVILFGATYEDVLDDIEKVTGVKMPEAREALAHARSERRLHRNDDWIETPHRTSGRENA